MVENQRKNRPSDSNICFKFIMDATFFLLELKVCIFSPGPWCTSHSYWFWSWSRSEFCSEDYDFADIKVLKRAYSFFLPYKWYLHIVWLSLFSICSIILETCTKIFNSSYFYGAGILDYLEGFHEDNIRKVLRSVALSFLGYFASSCLIFSWWCRSTKFSLIWHCPLVPSLALVALQLQMNFWWLWESRCKSALDNVQPYPRILGHKGRKLTFVSFVVRCVQFISLYCRLAIQIWSTGKWE